MTKAGFSILSWKLLIIFFVVISCFKFWFMLAAHPHSLSLSLTLSFSHSLSLRLFLTFAPSLSHTLCVLSNTHPHALTHSHPLSILITRENFLSVHSFGDAPACFFLSPWLFQDVQYLVWLWGLNIFYPNIALSLCLRAGSSRAHHKIASGSFPIAVVPTDYFSQPSGSTYLLDADRASRSRWIYIRPI